MSIIKKILSIMFLTCLALLFVGCGFTSSSKSSTSGIASIETITDEEDGKTYLVITYEDEEKEADRFEIPAGEDGVGIQTIVVKDNDEGTGKVISIYLSNDHENPADEFFIPNAISVSGITSETDEETGIISVYVNYSDGTVSDPIEIPKGETGETGNGIAGFTQEIDDEGNVHVTVTLTDDTTQEIIIPAQREANGIDNISSSVDPSTNEYILNITYTNGESEELRFAGPEQPSAWLTGAGDPSNDLGKAGDFYYDFSNNSIWSKGESWSLIASLSGDSTTYLVTFELNDPDPKNNPVQVSTSSLTYRINSNTYFGQNGFSIPVPTKVGYTFVGWYTAKELNPTLGAFTNFTLVLSNLTLYAIWEENPSA